MRKAKRLTVTSGSRDNNRDYGKTFLITEMPAMQAEKWMMRALLAVGRGGPEMPPEVLAMPSAAIMAIGAARALASMSFADAEPLLDEMMQCVEIIPDPANDLVKRPIDRDDIEEVPTLMTLRKEVLELHTGFSLTAALSTLGEAAKGWLGTPTTRTSPASSGPSSDDA